MGDRAKHPVRTTEKSLEIVATLNRLEKARVTTLADELAMGKSAVHNHLSTLEEHGYVIKDENTKTYRLSLKFLDIGGQIRSEIDVYKVAEPKVEELATESGELVHLVVEEDGMGVYLSRSKGERAVDLDTYVGCKHHMHSTAFGKAILAHLPRERVDEIVDQHGLPEVTPRTITSRDELVEELERTRDRGFAVDDEERLEGLRCIAAPIRFDSDIIGAISISGPTARIDDTWENNEFVDQLCRAANVIELNKYKV
ncbi:MULTISPECIES: IclR family transcriptional regulator [Natrialba]|uniref:Transcriptional regulator, IclR family protein n=1 Tax=Natrialba taiwanensis DSM 12281 TaxID=1230458 RepID=M0AEG4_9EURY|nr:MULTISPECIES: IclR family transcriptional regulator [Natrialba]ELY96267.1 transcriptional regulator, IclR family protein [Natrialba taiwanensis DSM 12281]